MLIIHIPFGKFQDVLPQIRLTLKTIKELYEMGIVFKIKTYTNIDWQKGEE